jgi:hypothetical protein
VRVRKEIWKKFVDDKASKMMKREGGGGEVKSKKKFLRTNTHVSAPSKDYKILTTFNVIKTEPKS